MWLACAVVTSSPRNPLRRIVGSGSAVLAYFAGVPLAFTWIALLGRFGELTKILEHIGINLNNTSFTISSLTGVELAYVSFQVPLMVCSSRRRSRACARSGVRPRPAWAPPRSSTSATSRPPCCFQP